MKDDAYRDINDLYLSMVTPEEVSAKDIHDPVMSDWIVNSLPDQASILDAGCGMGFHTVALHRGLPAKQSGKQYRVFGADYSESMLSSARGQRRQSGNSRGSLSAKRVCRSEAYRAVVGQVRLRIGQLRHL